MTEPAPSYSRLASLKALAYGCFPNKPTYLPKDYPDLTGKRAIVTGCNTGIGYEAVKLLYTKNCSVIMVVRTESKGISACEEIKKSVPDSNGSLIVVGGCDFGDLTLMKGAAQEIKDILKNEPLNIIIHNAGIMPPKNDQTSVQGNELIFQTNVMGPQLLQHFLDPLFLKKDSDLKRIVWVSSCAHLFGFPEYGINWQNPTYTNISISARPLAMILYGQSKAANIHQAKAWALKHKSIVDEIGCISVSCYPGNLNSGLTRNYDFFTRYVWSHIFYGSEYGAYSELFAALNPGLTIKDQGKYIAPFGEIHAPRADIKVGLENGSCVKLWDLVEEKISQYF